MAETTPPSTSGASPDVVLAPSECRTSDAMPAPIVPTDMEARLSSARSHVALLGARDDIWSFALIDDDKTKGRKGWLGPDGRFIAHMHGNVGSLWPTLVAANHDGFGVFATVNRYGPNVARSPRHGVEYGRTNSACLGAGATVPLDFDKIDDPGVGSFEASSNLPIAARISSSPGKTHLYLYAPEMESATEQASLMGGLNRTWSADPRLKDEARVIRLCGLDHMKVTSEQPEPSRHLVTAVYAPELVPVTVEQMRAAITPELLAVRAAKAPLKMVADNGANILLRITTYCEQQVDKNGLRGATSGGINGKRGAVLVALRKAGGDREHLEHAAAVLNDLMPGSDPDKADYDVGHICERDQPEPNANLGAWLAKMIGDSRFLYNEDGRLVSCVTNASAALDLLGYTARLNLLNYRVEINHSNGRIASLNDQIKGRLRLEFEQQFSLFTDGSKIADAIHASADLNAYHPIRAYLESLPEWDETPRIETWLRRNGGGVADTPYHRAVSSLPLMALVKRALEPWSPDAKFDEMLILESPQGWDKSSGLRALCHDPRWFLSTKRLGDDNEQKLVEKIVGKWIVELDECDALLDNKVSMAAIKSDLSRPADTARLSYRPDAEDYPRQCVVFGTMNPNGNEGYLRDEENRRFWPVRLLKPMDAMAIAAERDQLFAEALVRVRAGASIRLPSNLWEVARQEQAARRERSPHEDVLLRHLRDRKNCRISRVDVAQLCGLRKGDVGGGRAVAKSMRKLGWRDHETNGERFWIVGDGRATLAAKWLGEANVWIVETVSSAF